MAEGNRARLVDALIRAGWFDADWYGQSYPDVGLLGIPSVEHYRRYGLAMGRAPDAASLDRPSRLRVLKRPPPAPGEELTTAFRILEGGDPELGVDLAELYLPDPQKHCLEALKANQAIRRKDTTAWLQAVNAYLAAFGGREIRLSQGDTLFDRLDAPPRPATSDGPLVSVIMPAWNAASTVRVAAGSILDQTWRNLELIIVDDASTDNTWGVLQEMAASDSRVRIFQSSVNVGPYVCKNLAIDQAWGDWITGHDTDDWAHPGRLEDHLTATLRAGAVAGVDYKLRILPDGQISKISPPSDFSPDGIAKISSVTALFRTDVLKERIGYFDSVRFGADTEMLARTERIVGPQFHYLRNIGMICLDDATSLTNDPVDGIHARAGLLSANRANYMATWQAWLNATPAAEDLYLPFPQRRRRYVGDFDHAVPPNLVASLIAG